MKTSPLRLRPVAWLAALVAGGLHAASMGWLTDQEVEGIHLIDHPVMAQWAWLIQWAAMLLWCGALNAQRPGPGLTPQEHRRAARHCAGLGWLFGTAWLFGTWWWIGIGMTVYGHMNPWFAYGGILALAAALSLYMAMAAYTYARWHLAEIGAGPLPGDTGWRLWRERWRGVGSNAVFFASTFLLAELARALILTGFPWGSSGYAHIHGPLRSLVPWVGVYGVGALSALLAGAVIGILERRVGGWSGTTIRLALLSMVVSVVSVAAHADFTRPTGELAVSLLQGNVSQDTKFESDHLVATLNWHQSRLLKSQADLAIAGETAIPVLPPQLPQGFWLEFQARIAQGRHAVLTGIPLGTYETGYTNSILGFSPVPPGSTERAADRIPYQYDKHHLVPFGEFIPTAFRWYVDLMQIPWGDFARGRVGQASFPVTSTGSGTIERIAPNICFEDLFGEELARRFIDHDQAPTILANLGNIGWFQHSVALAQHLRISQMRSLELQRPMVRATNTGPTVIINHHGYVQQSLKPYTADVLNGVVQGREDLTPYAWWASRSGLWPLILLGMAVVAPSIVARTNARKP